VTETTKIQTFIDRWAKSGANERANYQLFLSEFCDVIGAERPTGSSASDDDNDYVFERAVAIPKRDGSTRAGRIDLYKKDCFVLEAKQGVEAKQKPTDPAKIAVLENAPTPTRTGHGVRGTAAWAQSMLAAKGQAENYAKGLPEWPPFLIIVDVGHVIELWADFSLSGKNYAHFPDASRFRIELDQLTDPDIRKLLHTVWTDPMALDPSRVSARVTRKIAEHLAALGQSFEKDGHATEDVARFLMRALFTMFAEDVNLIPKGSFTELLESLRGQPDNFKPMIEDLWAKMNTGGFSVALRTDLKRFNGGLFKECDALPVRAEQLDLLIEAANADWREVEPAIFGTLLERALSKRDRHKLGAHYTPRAYVERLVRPTLMEPLRADWETVKTEAQLLFERGKAKDATSAVKAFHTKLCEIKVLDPACGSGNFLYVAMEQMKRLEGEVTDLLSEMGEKQIGLMLEDATVDPHQFLGIELNPWAASVAELVLWIGYLQWHFRTYGRASPAEPVLKDFRNIVQGDAVLDYDSKTKRLDDDGKPVTVWDGRTTKAHPVTGDEVPDGDARIPVYDYAKPKATVWPQADFIIGNPPFIGNSRLRDALGSGYVEALWKANPKISQSADLVMFWWHKAALVARAYDAKKGKGTRRFGLITTNSIRQTFNRRVLAEHLDGKRALSICYAIPDHPWVDTIDGAAVRVAMTVAEIGNSDGVLSTVESERRSDNESVGYEVTLSDAFGKIHPNLRIGADVSSAKTLQSANELSSQGVKLHGSGFIVSKSKALELGVEKMDARNGAIRRYMNGRDFTQVSRDVMVIDLIGHGADEVREEYPEIFQHLVDNVKPERDVNRDDWIRNNWWLHGRTRSEMRPPMAGLERYIATIETGKHRTFQFLDSEILPDNMLIAIALDDAHFLSVLSSNIHVTWALAAGGRLGVGNDPRYNKSRCFDPYPFPETSDAQKQTLRNLGEQLDAHRKGRQAAHSKLTLTQMYNVLEKLRAETPIEGKDKEIYDDGQIGILKDLHDRIDAATADAYGWPADLTDEQILENLVALNKERAAEEARGHIRWLRPEYQNPEGTQAKDSTKQSEADLGEIAPVADRTVWPKTLSDQITAVRGTLEALEEPATVEQVAAHYKKAKRANVGEILQSLTTLGLAMEEDGRFIG